MINNNEDKVFDEFNKSHDGTPFGRHVYRLVWNYVHGDVDAYNIENEHLGTINPATKKFYKLPIPNKIFVEKVEDSLIAEQENLYEEFANNIVSLSDNELKKMLNNFSNEDFKKFPILFDLLVEQKLELLKYLYDKVTPFTFLDPSGANVLHIGSSNSGSFDLVKFLIERNICSDINVKTDVNETPFLLAVMYNHKDIVKYFIKNFKPDLSIKTIYGDDALSLAKKTEDSEMIKLIEKLK